MKVCVFGLWHLGAVTAACLADAGHEVVGLDFDDKVVAKLQAGEPPIFEPGLTDLIGRNLADKKLVFTSDAKAALESAEIVWVTFDTPVDEHDHADVDFVTNQITQLFPYLARGAVVLISSQLPVGTTRRLSEFYKSTHAENPVSFAYSPENLRLGKAIEVFTKPDRVVVGLDERSQTEDEASIASLLSPFTSSIEWMSIESAEMTKHALNAFLATSIAFINEVATICESVGADAKEVQRGLKSEGRIGPHAYLNPGAAFAGGTLARDIAFLNELGQRHNQPTLLMSAVQATNANHRLWTRRKLELLLGDLSNRTVAVWGLTYKPGTDTLRRSDAIALCRWLVEQGTRVQTHDPAVRCLPDYLTPPVVLAQNPQAALSSAEALVIATAWPEYRLESADTVVNGMKTPVVIDANRFLESTLGSDKRIKYASIGRASRP